MWQALKALGICYKAFLRLMASGAAVPGVLGTRCACLLRDQLTRCSLRELLLGTGASDWAAHKVAMISACCQMT